MKSFADLCAEASRHAAAAIRPEGVVGHRRRKAEEEILVGAPAAARAALRVEATYDGVDAAVLAVAAGLRPPPNGRQQALAAKIADGFLGQSEVTVGDDVLVVVGVLGAAAAVAIVVGMTRSGRTVTGQSPPTVDVRLLAELAHRPDDIGASAKTLQRAVLTPWTFNFADAAEELRRPQHRALTRALVESGRAEPAVCVGDLFDTGRARLAAGSPRPGGGGWVVAEVIDGGVALRGGPVLQPGEVRVETSDWHILSTHRHPVSLHICEQGSGYIPDELAYRRIWRVSQGLFDAGRLRGSFDEDLLQGWATSLVEALGAGAASDVPRPVAYREQRFQPLLMIQEGAAVLGDAVVTRVVRQGFAAPGGLALLPAVVEVDRVK